jgi:hypothetical protein
MARPIDMKNILLFASIATSLFCVGSTLITTRIYNGIVESKPHGFEFIELIFLLNVLYCVIGIILFLTRLSKYKNKFSKKYLLLIPSIINSIFLVYVMAMFILHNMPLDGMEIPILLFAIGPPLFLFYYINQKCKLIFVILLCLFFPINAFLSLIKIWGLIGK